MTEDDLGSTVLVAVDEQQRAYVPMADYEELRKANERMRATMIAIMEQMEWMWMPQGEPEKTPGDGE